MEGKIRSDLCRLAQLYLDGGVYMDNDIDMISNLQQRRRAEGYIHKLLVVAI